MSTPRDAAPLRVLHVVPHLQRTGGCELQALRLAQQQAHSAGVRPVLLTHADGPGGEGHASSAAAGLAGSGGCVVRADGRDGLELHLLPRGLRRHHPGAWWRSQRALGALPDVVHAHAVHKLSGQVVALAARAGVPCLVKVATPADVDLFAEPSRWREFVEPEDEPAHFGPRWRWMAARTWRRLRGARAFLALNDDIEARLRELGLRAERIRNGVDVARFHPPAPAERAAARAALGLAADAPALAFTGRLAARKDLPCVLGALARLPRATLLVCGSGPQAGALARLAGQLRVADRVRWLGHRPDVGPVLHAADAFVHASRSEGFPNALLEAFACGLPAALSDIAGHRDGAACPGDAALLFPPGDDAALAAALARLLDEARPGADAGQTAGSARSATGADIGPARAASTAGPTARGRAARALAESRYDLALVAGQMRALYEACTSPRGRVTGRGAGGSAGGVQGAGGG